MGSYFGGNMSKYITVSVKIPIEVKKKLDEYGIKPSKLLKEAIEREILKREAERISNEITKISSVLKKFSIDEVVESIREDRDKR